MQYRRYAQDTLLLKLRSNVKVRVTVTLQLLDMTHLPMVPHHSVKQRNFFNQTEVAEVMDEVLANLTTDLEL